MDIHESQLSLVFLSVDGTPSASTESIAQGMCQQHASAMRLVRKHIAVLHEFGLVRFEIRPRSEGVHGGGDVEYAVLNEQQAALLISLMRNSPRVVDFKVRLVKEFYRMRSALEQRDATVWQQRMALEMRDATSLARASFGSNLMLDRKRELPKIRHDRDLLDKAMQPALLN